jgi:murein DD-endopeptidase MepM/ murein hydrolase activator NlpD
MRRYLGILFVLAIMAWAYASLDGFRRLEPSRPQATREPGEEGPTSLERRGGDEESDALTLESEEAQGEDTLHSPTEPERAEPSPDESWETVSIGRGQSFYVAMTAAGVPHEDVMALVKACKPHTNYRRVQVGDTFQVQRNEDGELTAFLSDLDSEHFLLVTRGEEGWATEMGSYQLERTVNGVRGVITSSLFESLLEQDADAQLATQLSEILGWDIDFFRDIRKGDSYTLLYEEYTRDGERVRDGRILAASFTNQGREYSAFLYENELGFPAYYDEKGDSLEKQFLRAPLKYSRISSNFSTRRLHPVHKTYQPHYGVDYAAPTGTPVYATANGTVVARERRRGNGNYVELRHGNGYETFYLHLSRFAKGVNVGSKVKQGDLIGYVGMTGTATAPHLDYRVKHNGKWLNPRKLDLPPASPVSKERMPEYAVRRDELLLQLEQIPGAENRAVVLDRNLTAPDPVGEPSGR